MPTALSVKLKKLKTDGMSRANRRRGTKSVRHGRTKVNAKKR
jgi:hypothetical protein